MAAANGGKFAMDWSSAWYVYSFFGNTGMEIGLNEDGISPCPRISKRSFWFCSLVIHSASLHAQS